MKRDVTGKFAWRRPSCPIRIGAAVCYIQNNRLAAPSHDRVHSGNEKFANRLVEILEAQLRADFGRSEFKAEPRSACVNASQCDGIRGEPKSCRR